MKGLPLAMAQRDSLASLEASIKQARKEKRLADASEDLDRWLALSKQAGSRQAGMLGAAAAADQQTTGKASGGGIFGKFGSKSHQRRSSFDVEDDHLRKLVPKVQKILDKNSQVVEKVLFVASVDKHNAHGKTQARLLVITRAAVYNFDSSGTKLKRRIAFSTIGSVSASESSGQFVLHVPSE